jgi:hypothetical protein
MQKTLLLFGIAAVTAATMACGEKAATPVSPSPTTSTGADAAADGSTLKFTPPTLYSPAAGATLTTTPPQLIINDATSVYVQPPSAVTYRFQVSAAGAVIEDAVEPAGAGAGGVNRTVHQVSANTKLASATTYGWRARAEMGSFVGPWSALGSFTTPTVSPSTLRNIPINEAVQITRKIYDDLGYRIGSGSTREQRNVYLERAVAALHYGHVRFNPLGRDPNWCLKNGGPGRPQADDVIARCDTRDAWDLVAGIGADTYSWHIDYLGRLSGEQFVYPPSASALDALPR